MRPGPLTSPTAATKTTLRTLARRWQQLQAELDQLDTQLQTLVTSAAPTLVALPGVGVETAGQLLVTAGDNPERLGSEAAFAHLCGTAPIPASSGSPGRCSWWPSDSSCWARRSERQGKRRGELERGTVASEAD